ncbi:uncharacterized protein LAESUDRAFT_753905 [Laetiporus sulphureus 93-53]|uniref:Ribosomal RNA-processing protein 8 n=1 Tax=Laetiporus sulphureus 93-53 TaxID=1314785 RepID=A0A165IBW3_9APHY|nr:uncharacterized protein LAESUDRAFT_753905 [Laetiporus sulphureus 93-53]KZT12864.1 hypothetical protein LAESUDRAFT_753905 [Laetiporus sulphureus 93-53]
MTNLFKVPGWSVSAAPVAEHSNPKKRKRPAGKDEDKVQTAEINFEKLMAKLETGAAGAQQSSRNKKKKGKEAQEESKGNDGRRKPRVRDQHEHTTKAEAKQKEKKRDLTKKPPATLSEQPKPKKRRKGGLSTDSQDIIDTTEQEAAETGGSKHERGLTALQRGLKNSLEGARFRWINEQLYKSDSEHAHQMMRENPAVYEEYHTGFRHQVQSWPTNPVSHYISALSSYPPKTVVADLGCGDAALARALTPKGMTVISFDLVSDGIYIVEADTCTRLPLPGSEVGGADGGAAGKDEGEGSVVDVVVCALSLMGTNWPGCIREAWRVLRPRFVPGCASLGELKIAEVASRFTDVDDFVSFVCSFGFRLKSKDDTNSHFTLFEFKKIARKPKSQKEWSKLLSRGSILKPCEYKRR